MSDVLREAVLIAATLTTGFLVFVVTIRVNVPRNNESKLRVTSTA